MTPVATKLITAAEFARMPDPPDGSKEELVRGEIVTMPAPGFRHGVVQGNVAFVLKLFLRDHAVGRVTVESGLQTEFDPDTVRGPDVAFWSFERLPAVQAPEVYPEVAADLCVEVLTPSSSRTKIQAKVKEYLKRGVRMVWVVDPDDRSVTVYRRPDEGRVFWDTATLSGEDVLPAFSCPVAELFR
jgi:Uma2 family endonuclease